MSLLKGVSFSPPSDYQTWMFLASALSLIVISIYSVLSVVETIIEEKEQYRHEEIVHLPNFASIASTPERKKAFFNFLEPFVVEANREILEERSQVESFRDYFEENGELSGKRLVLFNVLRESYGLEMVETAGLEDIAELLNRVDVIPASMVLAQAAIESGWGTSRFARQGNNLFGIWCYEPGCGIVPRRRPAGETYEVAAYDTPRDSFLAYIRNLNTSHHYEALRDIRAAHRENGMEVTGKDLAGGLSNYSQERWTYVRKVRGLIASNRLEERSKIR
ncbi:glucosaminidase domain-containing protein [Pelagicoccus albus]|uniref:Glucosaminidase domain-containing protein n=2 Tax=Pelagicoccus albus TaxID=415222 RepID=A0A7X1B4J5_9BACT|nr:glucosaminidase domain-containing protein [Pelagicoccus albus]